MYHATHTSSALRLSTRRNHLSVLETLGRSWRLALVAAALVVGMTTVAPAQTVRFRSPVNRATVPLSYNGNYVFTNLCTVGSLVNPVDLSLSGLPAGATYSIAATTGALPLDGGFPSTALTTNLLITLTLDGSVPQGLYPLSVIASGGATNNWSFDLQVAAMWSGANYLAGVNTNWNAGGNWVGGSAPGINDDVVFGQSGATNAATITNVIVTASTAVSSVRFAPTNSTFKTYTVQINPGVTLGVGGDKGFSLMKDTLNAFTGNGGLTITVRGDQGTLAVTNENANFVTLVDNQQATTLDFSGLGNFVADVNQVGVGDYSFYPNYRNLNNLNSYGGIPRQFLNSLNLARTNIIKTVYADPFNSTNADDRHFGFSWLNTEIAGSTTVQNLNLGISNIFYVDSINFGGGNSRGNAQFNSIFAASNPIAIFRGTNGGRMSVFAIADGAGTNSSQTSPNNNVSFLAGTVDILADRFYVGRDRKLIPAGQNPSYVGNFLMGKGIVDAKTVILGFREYNQTNAPAGQVSLGYCVGRITVSNTAAFKVSESITLGSTVANNLNEEGDPTTGNQDQGQITLIGGGQLSASTIYVGGPVYGYSKNNRISVTNNSSLIVSNTCASANQMLDAIAFANGSQLTVTLNATSTVAVVYATNFNMVGSNSLVIAAIKNPGSLVNGMRIPLFKWASGAAPSFTVFNQSGYNGQIVTDGGDPLQQNFQVILSTPKNLIWQGYVSADWDNTTANWLDKDTLLHTNFAAGDTVRFDDTAAQFNLNLVSGAVILPGAVVMTNTTNPYIINNTGGGSIIGSSILTKSGTNSLTIDGTTSINVVINGGLFNGAGAIASATINPAATMDFSGAQAGNLNVAGVATVSGTVNGALVVQPGGMVTNTGTMNNSVTVNTNGLLVNNPTGNLANIGAASVVSAGGMLLNRGSINGFNLTISGVFKDTGEGTTTLKGTFTANSGATIIPGGDMVGTTTIQGGSASGFPGRVLLSQGSTNIFKVDILGAANSKLLSGYQDYGGSATARSQNGCTIVITNVTGNFAAGQLFTFFQYSGGGNPSSTGTATNTYPVITPATPGPGLAWDLTQLWPLGAIGVVSSSSGTFLTNSFVLSPNKTNIVIQFDWPATNFGWRLQSLVTPLAVGLAPNTNYVWTGVNGSWTNTTLTLTNVLGTNSVYYRLTFP